MNVVHINKHKKHQNGSNIENMDFFLFDESSLLDDVIENEQTIDEYYNQYINNIKSSTAIINHEKSQNITDLKSNISLLQKNESNIAHNIINQSTKQQLNLTNKNINKNCENDLNSFIQYLSLKLTKDKSSKISKDALIFLYKNMQQTYKIKSLTRDDKREKKRIYIKLFKISSQIIQCFEKNPQLYLFPVILFMNHQKNQKKRTIQRVNYLKKILKLPE